MKQFKAVIGKNFGDEGKGQMVNRLCHGGDALVVRHNGGAQAGHTVEEGNFRFVFHQVGSGSLQGCPTFWSRTFLPDMLKLGEELEAFNACSPVKVHTIYADPDCACATVYDVILNSLLEQLRGEAKHGSCGMGIYETVLRSREKKYALYLRDFQHGSEKQITEQLRHIRDGYTKPKLSLLKEKYPQRFLASQIMAWESLIEDENVLCNAAETMCENFNKYIVPGSWQNMTQEYETIIFEHAQGLMLDWDNEEYAPHLTASYTGLNHVADLLQELPQLQESAQETAKKQNEDKELEVIYVTRSYVTRHGAGRLDYECTREEINPEMTDHTNIPNPWQGSLRYARHPAGEDFFRYIRKDLKMLSGFSFYVSFCVTHLNETGGNILFSDKSRNFHEFCTYCETWAPGMFRRINAV